MIFERIKSEGLAHNSYFVGSHGEAVVIDPRRDCLVYADLARRTGHDIRAILETHRNEDYVIGSVELASATGVPVYHGPGLDWKYGNTLRDGEELTAGNLRITALHTPGHTPESMTYALVDTESGAAGVMAFTGDALFVGEVGRVDLFGAEHSERLARTLYRSLHQKILPLGDGTILCAAHGGGSVCGARISGRDESSLGIERAQNPMLQLNEAEFLRRKLEEQIERPPYFSRMEKLNLEGPPLLGRLPSPPRLTPSSFRERISRGALVVDTREPAGFCGAHIGGSYSIWLAGLSAFAGWVLHYDRPVLLVVEGEDQVDTAVRCLLRVGFDAIAGYLVGIEGWYNAGFPVESAGVLPVHRLREKLDKRESLTILDVRSGGEWDAGHIEGAVNIYVGHLEQSLDLVPRGVPVAVLCSVGRRASLGVSLLQRAGYWEVYNVLGGMTAWKAAGYPVAADHAPTRSPTAIRT